MKPPHLADRLLTFFCAPHRLEEVQGDLHEEFAWQLRRVGERRAKWQYWRDVLGFISPFATRRKSVTYSKSVTCYMVRNYFKIAWRNLVLNKVSSAINIGGLAVGLACCLTIGLFVWDELSYDQFHTNGKYIYRVVEKQNQVGLWYDIAVTPGPLAPALKADFAEIQTTCRISRMGLRIVQNGKTATESEHVFVTDNSFFTLFDFSLEKGNARTVLMRPDEVVISERIAEKFFGKNWQQSDSLLGQMIKINNEQTLTLTGIAKNPPVHSHIQFDVLLSTKINEANPQRYRWENNDYYTYIQVTPETNVAALSQKLIKYIQKALPKWETTFHLQPLSAIYLHSDFAFHTDWSTTSSILYIRIFSTVGLIILLIALFNFINLATARAVKRSREVGVRKAIGALRQQLIFQFLGESVLMTLLAIFLALLLTGAFLPLLNNIASKAITIPFSDPYFTLAILGLTLFVSLLAGLYPAFYLSRFQPVNVLKGIYTSSSGQLFRRSLVVGQFVFSIMLIIGTIVIYRQLSFLQNRRLGFDKSQLLSVRMKYKLYENSANMKRDLQNQSSIISVGAASTSLIDVNNSTHSIKWEGQASSDEFLMTLANIDPDFVPTTGMKLVVGRNFDASITTDSSSAYIINETAAKRMGWTPAQALNKDFTLWTTKGKIIGVVQDFHFRPLTATIEPFVFRYWPKESYSRLLIKTHPNTVSEAIAAIEKTYKKYEHQTAPQYEFVDQALDNQYKTEQRTGRIVLYFAILAIFVSCLGLFGLTIFSAEQRTKEIGIRKVLGASVTSIASLLSKDFIKLVLIALVIASPIAWWAMQQWLQAFAYKIAIQWWVFALAGGLTTGITLLTVSFQSIKAALVNPVKSLKSE